jgi:hypothetical protein
MVAQQRPVELQSLVPRKSTLQITVAKSGWRGSPTNTCSNCSPGVSGGTRWIDEPLKSVLEASYRWGPTYDWLDETGEELSVAHPLKVRAVDSARIKKDLIDFRSAAGTVRRQNPSSIHTLLSRRLPRIAR